MRRKGFTIIELLIVIAIIGILSTIILVSVNSGRNKAKQAVAKADVRNIFTALVMLENDTNQWPDHQVPFAVNQIGANEICPDGCAVSIDDPEAGLVDTDGNYPSWSGPYIKSIPVDPWGHEYFFDTDYDIDPGTGQTWGAVIGSYGPDGVGNNLYNSDDIIYIITSE